MLVVGWACVAWLRMRRWVRYVVRGSGRAWKALPDDSKRGNG